MSLQLLLKAYVELQRLHAEPGDKCHMLAGGIIFIQKLIREEIKRQAGNPTMFTYTTTEAQP